MDNSSGATQSSSTAKPKTEQIRISLLPILFLPLALFIPIWGSFVAIHFQEIDPAPLPEDHSFSPSIPIPVHVDQVLALTEKVGEGNLPAPEDLSYDSINGFLYTGCDDGWIRRVRLIGNDEKFKVEDVANVSGRPVGVAVTPDGGVAIAHAQKGLLKVTANKEVELLANEAEGVKFGVTDGVDVASDGTIYFTDASYKYNFENHMLDILEARPHGRLMSFDPSSKKTTVLVRDLYFANGVSVAPDQKSLIYCETVVRRCRRYHIQGEKKGTVENFIENLPGFPDNIRYDGEGNYWIAFSAGRTILWDTFFKYPILRKILYVVEQFVKVPKNMKNSGVLSVSLEGHPIALYSDPNLVLATSGLKIGNHLYYGSLYKSYISRIDLTQTKSQDKSEPTA